MSLAGKRILVTRAAEQAGELAERIRGMGGIPVLFPTIRLVPPDDPGPLDGALSRLASFDWIVFASANAAKFFCGRASEKHLTGPPKGVRTASVGPARAWRCGGSDSPLT
jgi:uroporphyrinogen-III synthase